MHLIQSLTFNVDWRLNFRSKLNIKFQIKIQLINWSQIIDLANHILSTSFCFSLFSVALKEVKKNVIGSVKKDTKWALLCLCVCWRWTSAVGNITLMIVAAVSASSCFLNKKKKQIYKKLSDKFLLNYMFLGYVVL